MQRHRRLRAGGHVQHADVAGQILCPIGSTVARLHPGHRQHHARLAGTVAVHVTGDGQPITTGNVTFTHRRHDARRRPGADRHERQRRPDGVTLPEGTITIIATTDNIPNRGVGSGSVTVTVDLPARRADDLTATVAEPPQDARSSSAGPRPAITASSVAGYDVRYAKVQITAATRLSTRPQRSRTPAARRSPGSRTDSRRQPLHRERLLLRREGARRRWQLSTFVATNSETRPRFNVTQIPSVPSGTEQFGSSAAVAEGDVNGDGFSDVLVGTSSSDGKAYLFFGSANPGEGDGEA